MREKEDLFKDVKSINFEVVCENFAYDWDMFQFSLRIFKDNYLDAYTVLENKLNEGNQEDLHRLIHSLKGAFNQVGAYDLGMYFLDLEQEVSEGNLDKVQNELGIIKEKIAELIEDIEKLSE